MQYLGHWNDSERCMKQALSVREGDRCNHNMLLGFLAHVPAAALAHVIVFFYVSQ